MFIEVLDVFGTIAFAISGALKGLKYHLDILGVVILGIITAIGGGILRDVLLNEIPAAFLNERALYFSIIASLLTYILANKMKEFVYVVKTFDAIGLAVFTIIGCKKGLNKDLGILSVTIMGTLTGIAGGVIRDMLVKEIPFILREEIYAFFCIMGGMTYWILFKYSILREQYIINFLILFIFFGRMLSIKYNLHLPNKKKYIE
ncbi:MAG: trimeric intracellular cation channel family protein [Fusobacteria bacterium]|nr:trimeric intracellular cation channel family protein [Fusobacteriota bacterium]